MFHLSTINTRRTALTFLHVIANDITKYNISKINFDMQKSQDGSSYIDRREMKHSLLDSSDRGESNGSRLMSLGLIDESYSHFSIFTFLSISRYLSITDT